MAVEVHRVSRRGEAELAEIAGAHGSSPSLLRASQRREQQASQDRNDPDDNKQFNQREGRVDVAIAFPHQRRRFVSRGSESVRFHCLVSGQTAFRSGDRPDYALLHKDLPNKLACRAI